MDCFDQGVPLIAFPSPAGPCTTSWNKQNACTALLTDSPHYDKWHLNSCRERFQGHPRGLPDLLAGPDWTCCYQQRRPPTPSRTIRRGRGPRLNICRLGGSLPHHPPLSATRHAPPADMSPYEFRAWQADQEARRLTGEQRGHEFTPAGQVSSFRDEFVNPI